MTAKTCQRVQSCCYYEGLTITGKQSYFYPIRPSRAAQASNFSPTHHDPLRATRTRTPISVPCWYEGRRPFSPLLLRRLQTRPKLSRRYCLPRLLCCTAWTEMGATLSRETDRRRRQTDYRRRQTDRRLLLPRRPPPPLALRLWPQVKRLT